ncbi:methyltransferase domain-containing protein [Microbispora sp. RL4-1S]|uniref:Methyltransferase domain-containing protein n=1 Tax=Microbispora oryzae TaxID=2806554 RepID=A0A941ANS1_9ACTN|nr:AarF/UbiB family protein [Microbispora oryzae]MBP2702989.1 methyltransferase domain-containing protein [Microbispora oryzae]
MNGAVNGAEAGAGTGGDLELPRPMAIVATAMIAAMLEFGSRTGLSAALADRPAQAADLAEATGGDERLAEEWLHGMVAAGLVNHDGSHFAWLPEIKPFIGGVLDVQPGVALFGALTRCVPAVAEAYRAGGSLAGDDYPHELADAMRAMSAQWTGAILPDVWLPAVPGLAGTLRRGGRVAEIGCASGETLEALATAFPLITAEGFDLDERLAGEGNARLADRGLAGRVSLGCLDAATGLNGEYDLILALSVLHDASDLAGLLTAAAAALHPGGVLLVVESPPLTGPAAAMLLATSVLYCVPATAARGGRPLGTLGLTPGVLLAATAEAGLAPVATLPAVHPLVAAYAFGRTGETASETADETTGGAVPGERAAGERLVMDHLPPVGRWRLAGRAARLTARVAFAVSHIVSLWVVDRLRAGRVEAQARGTRRLVRHLERMGPTYVKFGQMLASRADLFPAHVTERLAALHDDVTPMDAGERGRQLALAVRQEPRLRLLDVTDRCIGSGSIACVYEAVDPDGRPLAVKLQREGVAASMAVDLALLTAFTRVAERLPGAGGAPMADLVGYMSRALYGQIDFFREAAYLRRLSANLAGYEEIVVPRVHDDYTCATALVTDLVPGLTGDSAAGVAATTYDRVAARVLDAVGSMIFRDGFVHCDLHPGNIYIRSDGTVVILDAGYCVEMPTAVQHSLRDFFTNLALRNGPRCGEIMYDSAFPGGPPARHTPADRRAFAGEIAELVRTTTEPGGRFDMTDFGPRVFDSQKRFGVHPPADFAFPLMSLMIVEGTLRRWWPDLQIPAATGVR